MRVHADNGRKCEIASDALLATGTVHLRADGWSMLPTIWPGDVLVVENEPSHEIGRGAIILFRCGNRFVAHRVVDHHGADAFLVQGDAVSQPDAELRRSDLLGKVVAIQRRKRHILPRNHLSIFARMVAGVLRRSEWMARTVAAVYRCAQRSKRISVRRVVPCQN